MRQIALDTETTGFSPREDRIVEIGCVEIIGGQTFYTTLDPEREVPEEARQVHGLTWEMLKDSPLFADVCDDFLAFAEGSEVLMHNASFDLGFLDAELKRLNRGTFVEETQCTIVDTIGLAKKLRVASSSNSLNDLCDHYQIDRSHRILHGALLDADLLARLYLAMTGK